MGKPASFELIIVANFLDAEGLVGTCWLAAPASALLIVVCACGGYVAAHAAFVAATSLGSLPPLSLMIRSGRRLDLVAAEVGLLRRWPPAHLVEVPHVAFGDDVDQLD